MKGEDGKSVRERSPTIEYPAVDIPSAAVFVWPAFWEINEGRQVGMGFNPLSFSEIDAWARLIGFVLTPDEVRWIKYMDMALVRSISSKSKVAPKASGEPQMSGIPVTDTKAIKSLFDGLKGSK